MILPLNKTKRRWLVGFGICLGVVLLSTYLVMLLNDCPPSVCKDPIWSEQRKANAHVHAINKWHGRLLLEDKSLIPIFERRDCFEQGASYIFVCKTIDVEAIFPKGFNYAFSWRSNLKSYVGGVFIQGKVDGKKTVESLVCEAQVSGTQLISPPIDARTCAAGTVRVEGVVIP